MATGIPSQTAQLQKQANMSTDSASEAKIKELGIQSKFDVKEGVNLSGEQRVIVGSILDLFAGTPTLPKLSLWLDSATFSDPLTKAEGRKQYAAQWYGLAAAFSKIEQLHTQVTSAGNPIEMDLKTRYTVKGIGKETEIKSLIKIWTKEGGSGQGLRVEKVEDRWDGEIPEGAFAKVFRNLNSVVVPAFVSVPKSEEEEAKKST
ncbi:uncharacterized protein LY89DRAFT_702140 [Mollisia scopiformis]|uniref:Uncharacterized protein n=1 Tax=Mollisia scopiformis TaxID=149040 RepID=A0A132B6R2_MOLSC|nr:uncharacterized protein LY89DRAFT_702140 [Mollisia scopiformis]KUJ08098.1 hypothetical protein LY89DRAFT_702140 [Mollisia scopiformis]